MRTFLSTQTELHHGQAVFSDLNGNSTAMAGDLKAKLRLAFNRKLPAASLSKPITASDIRQLVDTRALSLDGRIADLLPLSALDSVDAAHRDIRLRHLLQHAAGFDRSISGDPLWSSDGLHEPKADCMAAADYILRARFDFVPGERVAYSNAGYCLLGKILVEHMDHIPSTDLTMIQSPLGSAGGWFSTLGELHNRLFETLPLRHIDDSVSLPDGSHYDFGWRHWPDTVQGPKWTHFGRQPGLMTVAVTDGRHKLMVAYFDGDPADVDSTALTLARGAWRCMELSE
ncbi:serine hydrolase domain-containing protein [Pseudoxanthomonas indica]|uniref:serine hydrolase domain-containing protein n=1 Tax=Pseudoxanthomonas indica TaxID=428993 RepID=UPI0015929541|nr:serine hydrolase domain-containing protein [Pseudoxanthomonas indica]